MRRALVAALAGAAILAGCGGEDGGDDGAADRAHERVARAEQALSRAPHSPPAMEEVVLAAHAAANAHVDTDSGNFEPEARRYLERAADAWPVYLESTEFRPKPQIAAIMVSVYGNGLKRPVRAAGAARLLTRVQPSTSTYLQWAQWSARAGALGAARVAGRKAVDLADPADRAAVRERVRRILGQAG